MSIFQLPTHRGKNGAGSWLCLCSDHHVATVYGLLPQALSHRQTLSRILQSIV